MLRLTLSEDSKVTDIAEVYYNDGLQIYVSSVAVHYCRYMLVGSVFGNMLRCQVHCALSLQSGKRGGRGSKDEGGDRKKKQRNVEMKTDRKI